MTDQNTGNNAPPRTLLGEVNAHLTCVLCRGYYIDATTIVECLHSFCRSCIIKHLQVKSYCPVCEMMINSAKPNIKPDKALQDIVYKLVPGLFQREMERRQQFYSSRPGPAASATPEQRGEDTERIIFSPEDVISFSLEYVDNTETESISSRSSESGNEIAPLNSVSAATRRYLQCPAVVNISHLKKFLSMKFDIDSSQYCIDILYKRVPLPDYYTLMDIAYIYNWKRNEPMRFFYQITDYAALRYALFDRKGSHFRDRKPSPATTEGTNVSSPGHLLHDHSSEGSSGANSPMPEDKSSQEPFDDNTHDKQVFSRRVDALKVDATEDSDSNLSVSSVHRTSTTSPQQSPEVDVEKSQFLNSFELTARSSFGSSKSTSPVKPNSDNADSEIVNQASKPQCSTKSNSTNSSPKAIVKVSPTKTEENSAKRKLIQTPGADADSKKKKVVPDDKNTDRYKVEATTQSIPQKIQTQQNKTPTQDTPVSKNVATPITVASNSSSSTSNTKAEKNMQKPTVPTVLPERNSIGNVRNSSDKKNMSPTHDQTVKRPMPASFKVTSPKRPASEGYVGSGSSQLQQSKQTVSPIKLQVPKPEPSNPAKTTNDFMRQVLKKKEIPDLKPNVSTAPSLPEANSQQINRNLKLDPPTNKLTQSNKELVKKLQAPPIKKPPIQTNQTPGDQLKSLFDSCKLNIPSSLSITLTDQKLERPGDNSAQTLDNKKPGFCKNNINGSGRSMSGLKLPSPPVHNSIEILKLPDLAPPTKSPQTSKGTESSSAKGPVPSLKPIADAKSMKQPVAFSKPPQTFQQSFQQSFMRFTEKPNFVGKNKLQMPNLVPTTGKPSMQQVGPPGPPDPKSVSVPGSKPKPVTATSDSDKSKAPTKSENALDLSTPHTTQSQLGPQQAKVRSDLEKMQTITNLVKKQNCPPKLSNLGSQSQLFPHNNLVKGPGAIREGNAMQLRIPMPNTHTKPSKSTNNAGNNQSIVNVHRSESSHSSKPSSVRGSNSASPNPKSPSVNQSIPLQSASNFTQLSPRSQTRSPSSSPKLIIACPSPKSQSPEEKQLSSPNVTEASANQSNQISSSQISSSNTSSGESVASKVTPTPLKNLKSKPPSNKVANVRQPNTVPKPGSSNPTSSAPDIIPYPPNFLAQHALNIRQHLEMQSQLGLFHPGTAAQWLNNHPFIENLMKSVSYQTQNDYPNQPPKENK